MAIFTLTPASVAILVDSLELGLDGANENHVDCGGENTDEDLNPVRELLAELHAYADKGLDASVALWGKPLLRMPTRDDMHDDDTAHGAS